VRTTWQRRGREEPKVLLVDPDDEMLDQVATGLRQEGFRVVALARREAAVPLFGALRPVAMVMAVRLEDDVPTAVARRLRALSCGPVPITSLIPAGEVALRRSCLDEGLGLDVMRLPAHAGELASRLRARFAIAHFELGGRALRWGMRFGAASFPDLTSTAGQIVGAAFRESRRPQVLPLEADAAPMSA
jgi:DNA-binding response OmpR family regulator